MYASDLGYRALLPDLFTLYENAMPVRPKTEVRRISHVLHAWFLRCQRGIEAVMTLDAAGYVVESPPLRRSVLEHIIAMAWLIANPESGWNTILRGAMHEADKRKESIERAGWASVDLAAFDSVIQDGEAIESSTRTMLQFSERCKAVGSADDWAAYLIETSMSHPGWQSAVPYLDLNHETGSVAFRSQPFDDTNLGQWAATHLFQALVILNSALEGDPLDPQLDAIQRKMIPLLIQARTERGMSIPDELQKALDEIPSEG